ncbi:MAG: cache domain-containing protein, partial [Geobacter sp.]
MLRNKRIVFILLTLLLLTLNVLFVALEWRRTNLQLRDSLAVEGKTLQAALDVTLETTFHNMLQLATVIAEDQRVQQLFQAGKHAVAQEGGGAGGKKTAAARQELLQLVLPMWQKQMRDYGARQLHFQLGPGALSFLRVHQPDKFGDRMDQVRHTIVDVNRDHKPRSGFETGRIYSGLRGVVPVWSSGDEKQREFLGALEVGTSFDPVLKTLDNRTGRGAAVLLNRDQVDQNMWQEFIKRNMLGGAADAPDSCYIEASSRPEVIRLLRSPSFK